MISYAQNVLRSALQLTTFAASALRLPFSRNLRWLCCFVIILSSNYYIICADNSVYYGPSQHYYQFPAPSYPPSSGTVGARSQERVNGVENHSISRQPVPTNRLLHARVRQERNFAFAGNPAAKSLTQPRNLHAFVIDDNTIRLKWNAPHASRRRYKYSVYYQPQPVTARNGLQRFSNTNGASSDDLVQIVNVTTPEPLVEEVIRYLQPFTTYAFKIIAYDLDNDVGRAGDSSDELLVSTGTKYAADDPNGYGGNSGGRNFDDVYFKQQEPREVPLRPAAANHGSLTKPLKNILPLPRRLQALPMGASVIKLRWQAPSFQPGARTNQKPKSYIVQYRLATPYENDDAKSEENTLSVVLNAAELETNASNSMFASQVSASTADAENNNDNPNFPLPLGYELTALQPNTAYEIRIAASFTNNDRLRASFTPWLRTSTLAHELDESRVPGMPERLEAVSISSNSFTIRWQPPANADRVRVRGYFIGWGRGVPDVYLTQVEYGGTSFTISSNIEPQAPYIISVGAFNNEGEGRRIEEHIFTKAPVTATLPETPPTLPTTPPATTTNAPLSPPIAVQALVQSAHSMVIRWADTSLNMQNPNENVMQQRLYTVRLNKLGMPSMTIQLYNTTQQYYQVNQLEPDTMYEVAVKTSDVKLNGQVFLPRESTWSATVANRTLKASPPRWPQLSTSLSVSAPTDLTVKPPPLDAGGSSDDAATSALITFVAPRKLPPAAGGAAAAAVSDYKISSYALYYTTSTSVDLPLNQWAQQSIDGRVNSFRMQNLKPLTTYHFRLQARDDEKGLGGPLSGVVVYTTPSLLSGKQPASSRGNAADAYKRSGAAGASFVADEQSLQDRSSAGDRPDDDLLMRSPAMPTNNNPPSGTSLPLQLVLIAAGVCFVVVVVAFVAALMIRSKMTSKTPLHQQQQDYMLSNNNAHQRRSLLAAGGSTIPITLGTNSSSGTASTSMPLQLSTEVILEEDEESVSLVARSGGGGGGPWRRSQNQQQQHVIQMKSFAAPSSAMLLGDSTDAGETTMISHTGTFRSGNSGGDGGGGFILTRNNNNDTMNRGGVVIRQSNNNNDIGNNDNADDFNNTGEFDDDISNRACVILDQHGNVIATRNIGSGSISHSVSPHQQQLYDPAMYPQATSSVTSPKMMMMQQQVGANQNVIIGNSNNPSSIRSMQQQLQNTADIIANQQQLIKKQQQQAAAARFFATIAASQPRRTTTNSMLYGGRASVSPPPTTGNRNNNIMLHGPEVIYGTSAYATGNAGPPFLMYSQQQQLERDPMFIMSPQNQQNFLMQQRQILPQHDRIEITHGTLRRGASRLAGGTLPQNSFFSQPQQQQQSTPKPSLMSTSMSGNNNNNSGEKCGSPAIARLQLRSSGHQQQQQQQLNNNNNEGSVMLVRRDSTSTAATLTNDATPVQRRGGVQNVSNSNLAGPVINFRSIGPALHGTTSSVASSGGGGNSSNTNNNSISPTGATYPHANNVLLIQHQRLSSLQQQQHNSQAFAVDGPTTSMSTYNANMHAGGIADSGFGSGTSASTSAQGDYNNNNLYTASSNHNNNPLNSFSTVPPPPLHSAGGIVHNNNNNIRSATATLSTSSTSSTPQPTPSSTTALINTTTNGSNASNSIKAGHQMFGGGGGTTNTSSDNQSDRLSMNSSSNYSIAYGSSSGGGGAANGGAPAASHNAAGVYHQQQHNNHNLQYGVGGVARHNATTTTFPARSSAGAHPLSNNNNNNASSASQTAVAQQQRMEAFNNNNALRHNNNYLHAEQHPQLGAAINRRLLDPTSNILGASPSPLSLHQNSNNNNNMIRNRQHQQQQHYSGGGSAASSRAGGGGMTDESGGPMLPSLYTSTEELFEVAGLDSLMNELNEAIGMNDVLLLRENGPQDNSNAAIKSRNFSNTVGEGKNASSRLQPQANVGGRNIKNNNNFLC